MTRINMIYNYRIFHNPIREDLFHSINQSNQRMLNRRHTSCKNINSDVNKIINCMFNCNSCSNVEGLVVDGGSGGYGALGGNIALGGNRLN